MVLEAQIEVQHRGCYTESISGNARAVQLTAGPGSSLLVVAGETPAQLEAILAAFARVNARPYEVVERSERAAVLRIQVRAGGVVRCLTEAGASILWPAIFRDGVEQYTIIVKGKRALADLVAQLRPFGPVRVRRQSEVATDAIAASVPVAKLLEDLTPKQLQVVLLAVARGYYRAPRAASAEELAAEFGVARSTFTEHLHKAEACLLAGVAAAIEQQPAMRTAARRRRGRPPARA